MIVQHDFIFDAKIVDGHPLGFQYIAGLAGNLLDSMIGSQAQRMTFARDDADGRFGSSAKESIR
jgi:hypothetical protein